MTTMRSWMFAGCIAIAVLGSASLGAVAVGARGAALGLVALLGVAGIGFLVTLAMKCDAAKKAEALASGRQKDEERRRERASTLAFLFGAARGGDVAAGRQGRAGKLAGGDIRA